MMNNWKNPYQHLMVFTSRALGLTNGNGKTLAMVIKAYHFKLRGYKIFSNFKVDFADQNYKIAELPKILLEENKALILCDEMNRLISAYDSYQDKEQKVKFKTLFKTSVQLRKKQLYLMLTAQSYQTIPAFLRRLSQNVFWVSKIHPQDETICTTQRNENCAYEKHHYYIEEAYDEFLNETLSPDLIIRQNGKYQVYRDYFYNCYDSDEVIE